MKQTKNHKLNLVEMSDTFSTGPLNENMETIDTALKSIGDTATDLGKRVNTLEDAGFVTGSFFSGGSSNVTVTLGFKPRAVVISGGIVLTGGAALTSTGFTASSSDIGRVGGYTYIAFK